MAVVDAERHQNDLVNELIASVEAYNPGVDRELIHRAFDEAERAHRGQVRRSGEPFVNHPLGVALICAQLHLDAQTIASALLHDVIEDTETDVEDLRAAFGDEIAQLVEGVTKLTRISFQSREQAEAENYRKMIVAMAQDVRVILIKLADRLHNMRTIEYLGKQKQVQKAKETLEVYAPLAHRLGIHAVKWELEDLAFQILHPRKYAEIKAMVADRRADREEQVETAAAELKDDLEKADIPADIAGRAKHFYSIYDKMAKKGREFNEIYDLTAMRVLIERGGDEGTRDCYAALGIIHSLWKPMPGRFKDFIAMPKLNRYRSLHTTVIGPNGTPLEIQVRTREMHEEAEFGVAAHWLYKRGRSAKGDDEWVAWVKTLMDWQGDEQDAAEYMRTLRTDLFDDEVYVFTPKGEVKTLPAGATPIDFAYAVHTDVGHKTVGRQGQRADRAAALQAEERRLRRDPDVEVGTWAVARLDVGRGVVARAQPDPPVVPARDEGRDRGQGTRGARPGAERRRICRTASCRGRRVLAEVIRDLGFKKAEDFYLAVGSGKLGTGQVVNKVLQRLKTDEVAAEPAISLKTPKARSTVAGESLGIVVQGVDERAAAAREVLHAGARRRDPGLHLARPRDHDPPRGLPEREGADAQPRAVHAGRVGGQRQGELPRADRRRGLGPGPPARGRRPDVLGARREHRRLRRHGRGRDGEELVHGRARRRRRPALAPVGPQAAERRVRRLPRDARLRRTESAVEERTAYSVRLTRAMLSARFARS